MVLRNSIVSSLLEAVPFPAEAVLKIAATLLADVPTQAQMISRQAWDRARPELGELGSNREPSAVSQNDLSQYGYG